METSFEHLRQEGVRLAPWHLQVEITPDLSTRDLHEASGENLAQGFTDPRPWMNSLFERLYPTGLGGCTALDVACNNGAFLFAAKEAGAGTCRGFDVRDIWIEQARFLARHRQGPSDDMHFDTCDIYDLPEREIEPADFTICTGLLYHLPNPIRALQVVAELTRGVMLLASASVPGRRDGEFVAGEESKEGLLSGVYGLDMVAERAGRRHCRAALDGLRALPGLGLVSIATKAGLPTARPLPAARVPGRGRRRVLGCSRPCGSGRQDEGDRDGDGAADVGCACRE